MKKELYFVMFIAGATVGALATWGYAKKKYEKIAQEEIDSVKKVFNKKVSENGQKILEGLNNGFKTTGKQTKEKFDAEKYTAILQNEGYINPSSENNIKDKKENIMGYPYIISPDEFGELSNYEVISLTYYADGVLADDNDEMIYDVEDIVGDALNHFGEYEDDSVFVRCDKRKCDYEILLDQRNFAEVVKNKPRQVEV